jgi:hypothetical protein
MADLAFEDAAEHYRVAVEALGAATRDAELRLRILAALGNALNAVGDIEAAAPRWLEAAQVAGETAQPERMLDCLEGFAGMLRLDGDPWVSALLDTLMDLLPPGDSAVRARAIGWRAHSFAWRFGPHESRADSLERDRRWAADALAMAERIGDAHAVAAVTSAIMTIESRGADAGKMLRAAEETARLLQTLDPATSRNPTAIRNRRSWTTHGRFRALLRLGRRAEAEAQLAEYGALAEQRGWSGPINNWLMGRAAIAIAEGRFGDGESLAARARSQAGRSPLVDVAHAAQVLAIRLEEGDVDTVAAFMEENLDAVQNPPSGWRYMAERLMLIGAHAEAGHLARVAHYFQLVIDDVPRQLHDDLFAGLAIRYAAEACRQLGDVDHAAEWLPLVAPWSGQLLVVALAVTIEGAADRSIGHLYATLGDLGNADVAYTAAAQLESSAGFPPMVSRTRYWHAKALIDLGNAEQRQQAVAMLDDVHQTTAALGMRRLAEQAAALRRTAQPGSVT